MIYNVNEVRYTASMNLKDTVWVTNFTLCLGYNIDGAMYSLNIISNARFMAKNRSIVQDNTFTMTTKELLIKTYYY